MKWTPEVKKVERGFWIGIILIGIVIYFLDSNTEELLKMILFGVIVAIFYPKMDKDRQIAAKEDQEYREHLLDERNEAMESIRQMARDNKKDKYIFKELKNIYGENYQEELSINAETIKEEVKHIKWMENRNN